MWPPTASATCPAFRRSPTEADTAEPAAPIRRRAPRRKAVPVGASHLLVHEGLELAAVVHVAERRGVGHFPGRDEVAAANLIRRQSALVADPVAHPLVPTGPSPAPGAAVSLGRGGGVRQP